MKEFLKRSVLQTGMVKLTCCRNQGFNQRRSPNWAISADLYVVNVQAENVPFIENTNPNKK